MSLQPFNKSFAHYVILGYEFATRRKLKEIEKKPFLKINLIDDAVIILDDIQDKSLKRNGKPSLYLEIGIDEAISRAQLYQSRAIQQINMLGDKLGTTKENMLHISSSIQHFLQDIRRGEELNLELIESKIDYDLLIKKYSRMVKLFTGGHIKYGLEIGQILANSKPEPNLGKAAEKCGFIRQIVDDFNDYFPGHHEPFGDFLTSANRLPEIYYNKSVGTRKMALKLINSNKIRDVQDHILNKVVRNQLHSQCEKLRNNIIRTDTNFDIEQIIVDFDIILRQN